MPSNIDELKSHCEKLLNLLNDPHPGLLTWQEHVADRVKKISEFGPSGVIEQRSPVKGVFCGES